MKLRKLPKKTAAEVESMLAHVVDASFNTFGLLVELSDYCQSPRVKLAKDRQHEVFALLFCDNEAS